MFADILRPHIEVSTSKSFKKGHIIYNEGDNPQRLYLLEEGLVGLVHTAENGHETLFRVFSKGQIFGHRSYLAEEPYHATSIALSPIKLTVVSKEECQRICLEHPDVLSEVTRILAKELGSAELRMSELQDKSANARITQALVYLKLRHPDHTWTRKAIADYAGSTFETVTRVMTLLTNEGLIEKHGRDFKIHDAQKLLNYSEVNF